VVAGEGFEPSIRQPPDYEPTGEVVRSCDKSPGPILNTQHWLRGRDLNPRSGSRRIMSRQARWSGHAIKVPAPS